MSSANVLTLPRITSAGLPEGASRVSLVEILDGGLLRVSAPSGGEFLCDWLDSGVALALQPGDVLLALPPDATGRGVVLGRIGPYRPPEPQSRLTLEATEVLTLKCGEATLDLRADGKAVLKGEDVLIRAKGLQRIKAGSVSIN